MTATNGIANGVAHDDMEAAITFRIGMRFIASVNQRASIHCIDTYEHGEEIRALGDLIDAGLTGRALRFNTHLARARKNLAGNQKRQHGSDDALPRNIATHQVIVMAPITVT